MGNPSASLMNKPGEFYADWCSETNLFHVFDTEDDNAPARGSYMAVEHARKEADWLNAFYSRGKYAAK